MGMIVPQSLLDLYADWWIALLGMGFGVVMGIVGAAFLFIPTIAGWRVVKAMKKAFWTEMFLIGLLILVLIFQLNLQSWREWSKKIEAEKQEQTTPSWGWSGWGGDKK